MDNTEYKNSLKYWMKSNLQIWVNKIKDNKNSIITPKQCGIMIRVIHIFLPIIFILILLFSPYMVCNIVIVIIIIISLMFYVFDCCFLSVLEKYCCEDNFFILDPLLHMLNIEINNANRYHISNLLFVEYIVTIFVIYYARFIHS